eukprot:TRINITY_DN3512_c0_g1_i3.p1 TRINITY_DN3512_c0_g1~~TRINITY_DN3512_c0_g1_i3.p1  ORF type:complete len:157 (+),score=24.03 TRINITY_DN3512_c0_g1_i3:35-505(+)
MVSRLPQLPTLRDIIRLYGLKAKQELSQNFILDLNVTDKLIQRTQRRTGPFYGKTVIEVGPGPGSLTRSIIAAKPKHVILIEKDKRFLPSMEMLKDAALPDTQVHIILGDALKIDEQEVLTSIGIEKKVFERDSEKRVEERKRQKGFVLVKRECRK